MKIIQIDVDDTIWSLTNEGIATVYPELDINAFYKFHMDKIVFAKPSGIKGWVEPDDPNKLSWFPSKGDIWKNLRLWQCSEPDMEQIALINDFAKRNVNTHRILLRTSCSSDKEAEIKIEKLKKVVDSSIEIETVLGSKGRVDCDYYCDDHYGNLEKYIGSKTKMYLMSTCANREVWNREYKHLFPIVKRISSISEMLQDVEEDIKKPLN